jgi:hypothetical protein
MLVNYRDIQQRFTHIDAELVSATITLKPNTARYVVRLYPWWEHPLYVEAIEQGRPWGFSDLSAGAKEVVVIAVEPFAVCLSDRYEVVDWSFFDNHPLLWRYEDEAEIFVNSDFDQGELFEALMRRGIPSVSLGDFYRYISPRSDWHAPYSLGRFPYSLYWPVREELERMGVRLFLPREPQERTRPILFLIDGEDYIIARDFEIELPQFEHRPEWFTGNRYDPLTPT